MHAGVFTTNREFVIRTWDTWIADISGIPSGSAVGHPLFALFPDIVERGLAPRLQNVIQNRAVEVLAPAFHHYLLPCAPRVATPNFVRMQQHVTLSPLVEDSVVTGVIVTIEDVTERLDAERAIAQELRSGDEATRIRAAETLARNSAGADSLTQAFGDESWKVRSAAVAGFAHRSGEEVIAALTKALREQHRDLSVVNAALSALAISGKDVLPELLAYLNSPDADLRIYVALALGNMSDPRATPALVAALNDENVNVRFHAIEALGRLRARDAAHAVAAIATGGDFFLAFAALDALALMNDATVVPVLESLLEDVSLCEAVVDALGHLGGAEAVAGIARALENGSAPAATCARALSRIVTRARHFYGDASPIPLLVHNAVGERGVTQLLVASTTARNEDLIAFVCVLGCLEGDAIEAQLIRLLGNYAVRHIAMDALVARGRTVVPALIKAVDAIDADDADAEASSAGKAAIDALGRIGSAAGVARLIAALDEAPDYAVIAAHALGSLGDESAFEPLIRLLDDPNATVRLAAVSAVNSIGSPQLHARTRDLLQHPSETVREAAVRIAGYFGYPDCTEQVIDFCASESSVLRRTAIEQLPFFDDKRVPGIIARALKDGVAEVRAAAARAIGRLDASVASSLLVAAIGDKDPWVRYHAARSADSMLGPELLRPLCSMATSDPHAPARIAAIDALGRIGDPVTTRVLSSQVDEDDDTFAVAALKALGRTGDPSARGTIIAALHSRSPARSAAALEALRHSPLASAAADDIADLAQRTPYEDIAANAIALLAETSAGVEKIIAVALNNARRMPCIAAVARRFNGDISTAAAVTTHGESFVRRAATEALGWCAASGGAHAAAPLLRDEDPGVRAEAELTLRRLDLFAISAING